MNIQSAILEGANKLKNKSTNSAKLDSEILLASVIDKDRKYLILNNDSRVSTEELSNHLNTDKFATRNVIKNIRDKNDKLCYLSQPNGSQRFPDYYLINKDTIINFELKLTTFNLQLLSIEII